LGALLGPLLAAGAILVGETSNGSRSEVRGFRNFEP
jgi:hypothetical protein